MEIANRRPKRLVVFPGESEDGPVRRLAHPE
ncbi:hypothetical protein J2Z21_008070 [Streptomyces griseochromogenes]|uniref:Transposase n=1 Tax=Streptomyces griseochromogenes TaxID=68214 RepID=A0ABS4M5V6_9ACTN|nr:hypothetical protein [Streptomyces griseochromogenes]